MDCKMRDSNDIINMYRKVLILTAAPEEEGSYRTVPGKILATVIEVKKESVFISAFF